MGYVSTAHKAGRYVKKLLKIGFTRHDVCITCAHESHVKNRTHQLGECRGRPGRITERTMPPSAGVPPLQTPAGNINTTDQEVRWHENAAVGGSMQEHGT